MKTILSLCLLFLACGGPPPLEVCLDDCHEMAVLGCITSGAAEQACLAQCHAGDVLSVAIQRAGCFP
jgi:hypothetical protein